MALLQKEDYTAHLMLLKRDMIWEINFFKKNVLLNKVAAGECLSKLKNETTFVLSEATNLVFISIEVAIHKISFYFMTHNFTFTFFTKCLIMITP